MGGPDLVRMGEESKEDVEELAAKVLRKKNTLKAVTLGAMASRRLSSRVAPEATEARQRSRLEANHKRFRAKDLYYSALDLSWLSLVGFTLGCYFFAICAWGLVSFFLLVDALDGSALGLGDAWPKLRALCWAAENVITMSSGKVGSRGMAAFVLGSSMHFFGIACNVLLFTVVATKFQKPIGDIIFSKNILMSYRDGVPTVHIRFVNRRCNLVFHPEIRATFMRPFKTKEGELTMKAYDLGVPDPAVVTGTFTLHHAIDDDSPLYEILNAGGRDALLDASFALTVTFVGLDSVYHDDVVAIHRYRFSKDLLFDHTFGWMSGRDPRSGKIAIDFDRIDEIVPYVPPAPRAVVDASAAARMGRLRARLDAARPAFLPGSVHVFVGALRAHDANPDAPLERCCCFSAFCEAALREGGVAYDAHLIDLEHKPAWYSAFAEEHGAPPQTPMALFVDADGKPTLIASSTDIVAVLPTRYPDRYDAPADGDFSSGQAEINALMGSWFVLLKATPLTARDALTSLDARQPLIDAFVDRFRTFERALDASGGAYLSGENLSGEDVKWAILTQAFWDFMDVFQPDAVDAARGACPKTAAWADRVAGRPSNASTNTSRAYARYVEHTVEAYFPFIKPIIPEHMPLFVAASAPETSPAARLATLHRALDGDAPRMFPGTVHLFVGALRVSHNNPDLPLERSCMFSCFVEAAAVEFDVPHVSHLVDLDAKPRWFLDMCAAVGIDKVATPTAVFVDTNGEQTFVKSSNEILVEFGKRCAPARYLPAAGAFSKGEDEVDAVMGLWFGMVSATPTTARAALATVAAREPAVGAYLAFWERLEAALGSGDRYLSGTAFPNREDIKWGILTAIMWETAAHFLPDVARRCEARYPKTGAWARRLGDRRSLRASRAAPVGGPTLEARILEHLVGRYFPKLAVPPVARHRLGAVDAAKSPTERLASARRALDLAAPTFAPNTVHFFVGALRRHDENAALPLGRTCCFSAFVEASAVEYGLPHETHLIDLDHKPAWYCTLAEKHGAAPETPTAAFVDGAGDVAFVASSDDILLELEKRHPERFAGYAPREGAFALGGAEVNALIGALFGLVAKTPAGAAAAALARPMLKPLEDAYAAKFAPLEESLAAAPNLSRTARPGREDLRWAVVVRAARATSREFIPDVESAIREKYPRTATWCARICATPAVRAASDDDPTLRARLIEHTLAKCFSSTSLSLSPALRDLLADAAPVDLREGSAAAAAEAETDAPDDDDDHAALTGLEPDELVNFCL